MKLNPSLQFSLSPGSRNYILGDPQGKERSPNSHNYQVHNTKSRIPKKQSTVPESEVIEPSPKYTMKSEVQTQETQTNIHEAACRKAGKVFPQTYLPPAFG